MEVVFLKRNLPTIKKRLKEFMLGFRTLLSTKQILQKIWVILALQLTILFMKHSFFLVCLSVLNKLLYVIVHIVT